MIPILSAPNVDGSSDGMLAEAIVIASKRGLVAPHDHVVCLLAVKESLVVKILSIDELGSGMVSGKKGTAFNQPDSVSQAFARQGCAI